MSSERKPMAAHVDPSDNGLLDDVDRRLLAELTVDPRLSRSELARRTGVSTPTASNRVARLERRGVIRGYRLDVDPAAIGLPIAAWVRLRPGPGQGDKLADLARRTSQVSECHRISGEDCFLLKVHVRTVDELEPVLDAFLLHGQTTSSFVLATPVPPRPPHPPQP